MRIADGNLCADRPSPPPPPTSPSRRSCLVVAPIVGGALLLLVAVALVAFLGLRHMWSGDEGDGEGVSPSMPLEVVKLTPTAFASPLSPPGCETIINSGDVQIAVSLPASLTVGAAVFPIVPTVPQREGWTYPSGYPGSAAWVCGTVVNYVVGLEPTPENEALLAGLRAGDEINMHLSNGVALLFRFDERREAAPNEAGVFEQTRPRLTLIVETEGGTWQVATADYISETEPIQPPSGTLAQPGQPVRVGDAQVTVAKGYAVRDEPGLLPGTMYYLVEFSVQNAGEIPLNTGAFTMQLQDGMGNRYLLSSVASAAGEHGPLGGEIEPGATVEGTAGYLVPETLAGPTLIWTFSPRPDSDLRASVSIPYAAEEGAAVGGQAEVVITDAFLSSAGDVLIIEGEVRNSGSGPLTVELSDISLTSSAGMSELRMAAPPLPWTIQPDQAQVIELQYEKPAASTVLLTLLGYSFEIQGL